MISLVQGEQQPGDGCCQSRRPQDVETLSWTHAHWLLHPAYRQDSGDESQRHAKIKYGWPAPECYELTTQQWSECRGERREHSIHAESCATLFFGECQRDKSWRTAQQKGSTDTLHKAER